MIYKTLLSLMFVVFSLVHDAQEVSNIHFEQVGNQIHIYYDLEGDQQYHVDISCWEPYNDNALNKLINVVGDIGDYQQSGIKKHVIWNVIEERDSLAGEIVFIVNAYKPNKTGFFIDNRDNQSYKWVEIGNQTWMAENLNYSINNSWCYDNNSENCDVYGRLYSWYSAPKACPLGWHLPNNNDWEVFALELGLTSKQIENYMWDGNYLANSLKSTSKWDYEDFDRIISGNGTNSSGFNALPGGWYDPNGSFGHLGWTGAWWSSTNVYSDVSSVREVFVGGEGLYLYNRNKGVGYSVRCLKD